MPNLTKHDLEFRPLTYWGPVELETHLLSTIKGEIRRQYVKFLSREGKPDEVDASVAKSSLSESERSAVGRIHPAFMGGEYLPDLQDTEVEIARIVYNSTMLDVISIRARRAGKRIAYSIVDEYEDEYADERYECHPKTSKRPLTLRQLIHLIDNADLGGLTIPIRERHVESGADPEEMVNFARVSSEFYPKLAAYYEQEAQEWLDKRLEEARIEGVGEEELEEFQEQRRRAIENAPPMAPTDFASHMRVRDLDDIGLAALQKWLREVKNIKDATVLKRPSKIKFGCMARGEQFWLEIKWSDGSETNCLDFRPETLVQEAFSAF